MSDAESLKESVSLCVGTDVARIYIATGSRRLLVEQAQASEEQGQCCGQERGVDVSLVLDLV